MIKVCCDPYELQNRYNFGDMISMTLLERLSGQKIQRVSLENVMDSDIICAGSILEYIPENYDGYIWGTGFMFAKDYARDAWDHFSLTKVFKKAKVLALRGMMTKQRAFHKGKQDVVLADPGILANMLKDKDVEVGYELGVVPHYVDQAEEGVTELLKNKDTLYIDVLDTPTNVVNNIARCKNIIASSLHGVVVGDSLGIPTEWRKFSNKVGGAGFKFRDYYSVKEDIEERKRKLIEALPTKYKL